ncbi:DUF6471 domain-containing protein [Rhodoferax sp. TS-BS-61-7]|uniref:DUF6471 domain-containing protein n=1 Tax=Rhodoferax sp. TS-BS-61-7 TaxID=2094194 RepID=UPI000CF6D1D5|nr:DUF6471 domain-containing protein [Rhodoferax sp. TS-BS-61-7]PQA78067.1 hypothetical protein C5F53_06955 [Rhodoferax sp. TS-BS-61-7]
MANNLKRRAFYDARAKALLRELRESKQVTYADLAKRLEGYGGVMSERVLISRFTRGTFSLSFALMVLDELGVKSIEVPHYGGTGQGKKPKGE